MSFRTISEDDAPDYEVWTCDTCGFQMLMQGVGGDVSDCPRCISREIEEEGQ